MPIQFLFIYLGFGAIAGLTAGLFGVGGGLVMVPALIYCFSLAGFDQTQIVHIATATSLAVIIFNTLGSSWGHYKKGNTDIKSFVRLSLGCVSGSVLGSLISHRIDSYILQWLFIFFVIFMSIYMYFGKPTVIRQSNAPWFIGFILSMVIGVISSMLGIGGGVFFVPLLCWWGLGSHKSVGTSSLLGVSLSISASLISIFDTQSQGTIEEGFLGYIYLPAFFAMLSTGPIFSYLGSQIASKLPAHILKKLFALLLLVVAGDLIFETIKF